MIRRMRRNFIRVTMLAVFIVLFSIALTINVVNYVRSSRNLDGITALILDNGGGFPKNSAPKRGGTPDPKALMRESAEGLFHERELPFATRFFAVFLDNEGKVAGSDLSNMVSVTSLEAAEIARSILERNRETGWWQNYRYRTGDSPMGRVVIVVEATAVKNSIISVFVITSMVALASFLLIFVLVIPLSSRAVRPIAETYEKQKRFITDAGHELKTPLTVISANAEVLSMTGGGGEWCDGILRQCDRMRVLVGRMIEMSRLDEGGSVLSASPFDLSDAVYDTALSFNGPAQMRSLEIVADIPQGISMTGDESAVRELVSILMDNSVKYADEGGRITVSLSRDSRALGKDRVVISVRNTFSDAPSLETEKLFERFYRGDGARSGNGSYGLGLSIASSIAFLHGGEMGVKTHLPDEVEFSATFPMRGRAH